MHELKESVCEVMTPSWDDKCVSLHEHVVVCRVDGSPASQLGQPEGESGVRVPRRLQHLSRHCAPQHARDHLQPAALPSGRGVYWPYCLAELDWTDAAIWQFKNRQLPPSASTIPSHPYSALQPLAGLIRNTLVQVDPDLQATLLANVVVTGGTTLIPGFVDRLQAELGIVAPGMKIKIRESLFRARCSLARSDAEHPALAPQTPPPLPPSARTRPGSAGRFSLRSGRSTKCVHSSTLQRHRLSLINASD